MAPLRQAGTQPASAPRANGESTSVGQHCFGAQQSGHSTSDARCGGESCTVCAGNLPSRQDREERCISCPWPFPCPPQSCRGAGSAPVANPKVPPSLCWGWGYSSPRDGSGAEGGHEVHGHDPALPRATAVGHFLLHRQPASGGETFSRTPAFLCPSVPVACLT